MTETQRGDDLPLRDAVNAIATAARFEEPLRQRTEGLTWMIMAFIGPGIFLSYAFMGVAVPDAPALVEAFLWLPWVATGVATTIVLWNSAALTSPGLARHTPSGWAVTLGWLAALAVAWAGVLWLLPDLNEPTFFLLWIGTAWAVFGAVNLYKNSARGRRFSVAIGVTIFLVGVALALTVPGESNADYLAATTVASVASGLVPLVAGFWQATRG